MVCKGKLCLRCVGWIARSVWRLPDFNGWRGSGFSVSGQPQLRMLKFQFSAQPFYHQFMVIVLRQSRNGYRSNHARADDGYRKRSAVCREFSEHQPEIVSQRSCSSAAVRVLIRTSSDGIGRPHSISFSANRHCRVCCPAVRRKRAGASALMAPSRDQNTIPERCAFLNRPAVLAEVLPCAEVDC